jgi:dihydrofolate reductase
VRDLKTTGGPNIAMLGSGSIAAQLGEVGLVDEYQFVIIQLRAQSPLVFSAERY